MHVAAHIRDLILTGHLVPGQKLRLVPLAEALKVSTTPIREALLLLEAEGLVRSEARRGFRVKAISREDIRDLFELHAFIAGKLAERATLKLTQGQLRDLLNHSEQIKKSATEGNGELVEQLNFEFHRIINRAAESPILARFLAATTRYVPRHFYAQIAGWMEASATEHDPILDALQRGDPAAARTLTEEHIRRAGVLLVDYLETKSFWTSHGGPVSHHPPLLLLTDGHDSTSFAARSATGQHRLDLPVKD